MRLAHRWSFVGALALAACTLGEVQPAPRDDESRRAPSLAADPLGGELIPLLPQRSVGAAPTFDGHVALVRWWTDGCPFCERSLPALEALRARHAARGLIGIAVYHPKPPRALADDEVAAMARELDWNGFVLVDEDWSALRAAWLDAAERAATSVTFLLDRAGRVRFVHPGPELHPSDDALHADCARDFRALEAAVDALLTEPAR